jgi:hypothetical protein
MSATGQAHCSTSRHRASPAGGWMRLQRAAMARAPMAPAPMARHGLIRLSDPRTPRCGPWTPGGNIWSGSALTMAIFIEWQNDTATIAAKVMNAPTAAAVVVTPERFMFALGADGDPRAVAWSDQEDDTEWTAGPTTQAGSFPLQTYGRLMCGKAVKGGTLVFSDLDVHLASYHRRQRHLPLRQGWRCSRRDLARGRRRVRHARPPG